jgi:RNA polymerase sigma-70 factor (ECF subfamily)
MTAAEQREKRLESISDNVTLAAGGDAAAFARLIESCEGMLYRVCRSALRSDADAADAAQETVIAAWQRIGQLRHAESFPAWLAKICINRCRCIARSKKPGELTGEPQAGMQSDARMDVEAAVESLPQELRPVVVLYYFEDWSIRDIARATGTFEGTVKSRLHRARKLLTEALYGYQEEKHDGTR